MEFITRIATLDDVTSIAALSGQLGYQAETDKMRKRLARILASKDDCVFVADNHGIIAGWIHGYYTLGVQSDPFVEIAGLVVDEKFRRKGIAALLVNHVSEWATLQDAINIRVRCNTIRLEAHRFYGAIGFHEIKEQKIFQRPVL